MCLCGNKIPKKQILKNIDFNTHTKEQQHIPLCAYVVIKYQKKQILKNIDFNTHTKEQQHIPLCAYVVINTKKNKYSRI